MRLVECDLNSLIKNNKFQNLINYNLKRENLKDNQSLFIN